MLRRLRAWAPFAQKLDPWVYAIWAGFVALASARLFYGYMLKQTEGEWSAPLDDVFIHFDYARQAARGHPFEWAPGNGVSSGNTSLTYPFVLAIGWVVGFQGERLMVFAALVACLSVFALLLASRAAFLAALEAPLPARGRGPRKLDPIARAASYLVPPMLLGVGALDWSLWSGMEVAFFLFTWALAFSAYLGTRTRDRRAYRRATWLLGLGCALMCVTRPEAATTTACFGFFAAASAPSEERLGRLSALLRVGLPSVVLLALQALMNRHFTGETTANGALVKLALYNPYLTAEARWDDFCTNLRHAVLKNLEYHFADEPIYGPIVPLLAFFAAASKRTRRVALLLWAQLVSWLLIVGLNGQVRWQNERYTMPAVAWLLLLAAIGAGALFHRAPRFGIVATALSGFVFAHMLGVAGRPPGSEPALRTSMAAALVAALAIALVVRLRPGRGVIAAALLYLAYDHQIAKMRDQKWFFGRASRNIRDQQTTLGRWLRTLPEAQRAVPPRVLVGDAGAILYASDFRGLDLIGLGGYHDLPFARALGQGLGASIELIERMPERDRPELLAIFPSWWGILPTWFSSEVIRRFPIEGNVICGDFEHVVYRADWSLLGTGEALRRLPSGTTQVKDTLDTGDLVSERAHRYGWTPVKNGFATMKILPDPNEPDKDMFDGGREVWEGKAEHFELRNLVPGRDAHLVIRSAPEHEATVRVLVDGAEITRSRFVPAGGFVERPLRIPGSAVREHITVTVENDGPGMFTDYHVYITQ